MRRSGFNASTRAVNLVGFDTNSGKVEYDIKLPFYEGPFVGMSCAMHQAVPVHYVLAK